MVDVYVSRHFTAGWLVGLTIDQTWHEDARLAPKVGDVLHRKCPAKFQTEDRTRFTDTVVRVAPRNCYDDPMPASHYQPIEEHPFQ